MQDRPATDFAGTGPPRERYRAVRYLSDHLRAQAQECYRLAKEARDRWVAKLLENLGHQLHERADQLESRDDRAQN
jgi:hypothetical protein